MEVKSYLASTAFLVEKQKRIYYVVTLRGRHAERRTLQNLWRGSGPRRGRWAYFPQGEGSTPSYRTR